MTTDAFIHFDQIAGEAEDKEFLESIEVLAWNWGVQWQGDLYSREKSRGVAAVRHFTFQHHVDSATTALLSRCCTGALVPKVRFVMRRAAGSSALRFVEVLFQDVRLVDVSMGHAAATEGLPVESVTFAFERVSFDYIPQARKGAGRGRHNFTWAVPAAGPR